MEDCVKGVRLRDRPAAGSPGILGFHLNSLLPPSLRMSDRCWMDRVGKLSLLSKRDILKECKAAWRRAGARVLRGQQFGRPDELMRMLHALHDMVETGQHKTANPQRYEEAIHACVIATDAFRRSAPKLARMTSDTPHTSDSKESLA